MFVNVPSIRRLIYEVEVEQKMKDKLYPGVQKGVSCLNKKNHRGLAPEENKYLRGQSRKGGGKPVELKVWHWTAGNWGSRGYFHLGI